MDLFRPFAVAREYAGSRRCCVAFPGLADSPWATRCRPRVRGLLSSSVHTQGSRTRPGLHAVAREYAGLCGVVRACAAWCGLVRRGARLCGVGAGLLKRALAQILYVHGFDRIGELKPKYLRIEIQLTIKRTFDVLRFSESMLLAFKRHVRNRQTFL